MFQGFNWQTGTWKPTPGRTIRAHAMAPAEAAQSALTLTGELAHLSLHAVSSRGWTDPSELHAGLCES